MTAGSEDRLIWRFMGGLLMAAGGLLTVTGGFCSVALIVLSMNGASVGWHVRLDEDLPILGLAPLAVGLVLYFAGRLLWRGGWKKEP